MYSPFLEINIELFKKRTGNLPVDDFIKVCENKLKNILYIEDLNVHNFIDNYKQSSKMFAMSENKNYQHLHELMLLIGSADNSTKYVIAQKLREELFVFDFNSYPSAEIIATTFKDKELFNPDFKNTQTVLMFEDNVKGYDHSFIIINSLKIDKSIVREYMILEKKNPFPLWTFYTIEGKEPRIYINCGTSKECNHYNPISPRELGHDYCMKTLRTMHKCKETSPNRIYSMPCFLILYLTKKLSEIIKPRNTKKKSITFEKELVNEETNKKNENVTYKSEFINIYVNNNNVEKFEKIHTIKKVRNYKTGTNKSEHIRREHTRTYKNGKVVVIKSSTINKGKGQKPYYIK